MSKKKAHWVTVAESQTILGKSEKTIRRWVKSGKLKSRRDGRRVMVNVSGHMTRQSRDTSPDSDRTDDRVKIARLEGERDQAIREITLLREALAKEEQARQDDVNRLETENKQLWEALHRQQVETMAALNKIPQIEASTDQDQAEPPRRWWWPWR